MSKEKVLAIKLVEVLGKRNPTAEEKKLQALIKQELQILRQPIKTHGSPFRAQACEPYQNFDEEGFPS